MSDARRDRRLTRTLERWFELNRRDLPWRTRRTGYTALVAEAMLQQTQVSRVIEHYHAFLARFPTVHALADADEQAVLAGWQGLGYYRRARHLHAAARMVVDELGGRVPSRRVDLERLPGVGRYTAAAIASIVHGHPEAIVDGNVTRVLARLDARDDEGPEAVAWTWARAETLVNHATRPGLFNEALMELGATVCTPRRPACGRCPVARSCHARRQGRQDEIPPPRQRATRRSVHHTTVVVSRGDRILLEQRPPRGLWSNMWQTPTIETTRGIGPARIVEAMPVPLRGLRKLASFDYRTTHRDIRFHVHAASSNVRRGTWRHPDDVADLPMSNAQRRVLARWSEHRA